MPSTEETLKKREAAREVIDVLQEIAVLLGASLNRAEMSLCVSLIENGVNPEALATVIKSLRKEDAGRERERERARASVGSS